MFLLGNKRVLLVSLMIFFLFMITSQARNMPKERIMTEDGGEKMVKRTENIAPAAAAITTTKQDEKMVTAKENLVPKTVTDDLNMMDYSPAAKKTPIHN